MPMIRNKRSIDSDTKNEPIAKKNIKLDLEKEVKLPDEVWLKVMSYINTKDLFQTVALVCKHFHNLTMDGDSVKFLKVTNISNNKLFKKVQQILKHAKSLKGFKIDIDSTLDKNKKIQNEFLNKLCIQALTINGNLKSLGVHQFGYKNAQLKTETWDCLIQHGKELQHFELGFLKEIPFGNFKNLKKLKSLTMKRVKFADFKPNDLMSLAKNCTNLEILKIDVYDRPEVDLASMNQAFNIFFMERQSTLKSFTRAYTFFTNMLTNLSLCQNLEEFECNRELLFLDDLDMIYALPNLKKLIFDRIFFNDSISTYLEKLNKKNLECLIISNCRGFDKSFFTNMPRLCFPKLKTLFIDFPKEIFDRLDQTFVLDTLMRRLTRTIPTLESIQLEVRKENLNCSNKFDLRWIRG